MFPIIYSIWHIKPTIFFLALQLIENEWTSWLSTLVKFLICYIWNLLSPPLSVKESLILYFFSLTALGKLQFWEIQLPHL